MSRPAPKGKIKGHPTTTTDIAVLEPGEHLKGRTYPMGRCTARSKTHGGQCKQPVIPGATVCQYHGGGAPQVKLAALERLKALQHPAIDTLHDLMDMRREFPSTGYAAARDVLDRTLGKAAETVRQEHTGEITIVHEFHKAE